MRDTLDIIAELTEDISSTQDMELEFEVHFAGISQNSFPGRGLVYSFFFHVALALAIVFWPIGHHSGYTPRPQWVVTMIPKDAIFLPRLGGGNSGAAAKGGSERSPRNSRPQSVAAQSKAGVSYPGAQPIVSNPPNPTNRVQTILQPELPNPIPLKTFVPLPNVVKLAVPSPHVETRMAENAQTLTAPEPAPAPVPVQPVAPVVPIAKPKLPVPLQDSSSSIPLQTLTKPPAPSVPAATPRPPLPKPQALPVTRGINARTLLVLSPTPTLPSQAAKIPAGEARGQFAITAQPNLAMTHLGPGAAAEAPATAVVGVGTHPDAATRDATGSHTASPGSDAHATPGGGSLGMAPIAGAGGTAAGSALGSGTGNAGGRGPGKGSGAGGGAGAGTGAFPGITIQGGEAEADNASSPGTAPGGASPDAELGSYGLTIVSTGNSGGGIGDFGIFYDEPVFTVYVAMQSAPGHPASSWTLQYAQVRGANDPVGALTAPFPLKRGNPDWPPELLARYTQQLMVVYSVIDEHGKMQKMRMMQTPNSALDRPLFDALEKWVFRPAKVNGQPVAVKVLLGVPLI